MWAVPGTMSERAESGRSQFSLEVPRYVESELHDAGAIPLSLWPQQGGYWLRYMAVCSNLVYWGPQVANKQYLSNEKP